MGKLQETTWRKNQTAPNIVGVSPTLLIIFEDARARARARQVRVTRTRSFLVFANPPRRQREQSCNAAAIALH